MKAIKIMMIILAMSAPAFLFAQSESGSHQTYQRKTVRKSTKHLTRKDSLKTKENAPILNDNGTSSTTGTIDGRSSTGRPGADTLTSYSVRKKKTTVKTVDGTSPEAVKSRKKKD
ncbi:hypothetical protein [Dyadobacter sp. 32]|uniref:hypothetical protein n=1 Tax=Dyadobacter sp. 32 TaxID=538966 RepID=UPI0011EFA303